MKGTLTLVCGEFTYDTVNRILSESAEVCRSYDKDILTYFFSGTRCSFVIV